jgi:hypothetical protein
VWAAAHAAWMLKEAEAATASFAFSPEVPRRKKRDAAGLLLERSRGSERLRPRKTRPGSYLRGAAGRRGLRPNNPGARGSLF